LWTVALCEFATHERGLARISDCSGGFNCRASAFSSRRIERSGTYGDDLHAVGRLYGRNRVAGVDGTLEGICRLNSNDIGDLRHIELGRDARSHVLAG